MSKPKKNATPQISEEEYQRRHLRWMAGIHGTVTILKWIIGGAAAVGCFYVTFALPVIASHGETTTISVVQNFVANLDAQVWVSWAVSAGAAIYGLNERRLRRRERDEKDARIAKMEQGIDPGRTSSGVNQRGDPQ